MKLNIEIFPSEPEAQARAEQLQDAGVADARALAVSDVTVLDRRLPDFVRWQMARGGGALFLVQYQGS